MTDTDAPTDTSPDLSRRKLLGAMGTIGGAAALGGAGTMAFFSDEEEFANNQLVAGELDLQLAWQEQYYGAAAAALFGSGAGASAADFLTLNETTLESYPDPTNTGGISTSFQGLTGDDPCTTQQSLYADASGDLDPASGFRSDNADTVVDGQVQPLLSIQDTKPGDFGLLQFKLILCDNPGYVWTTGEIQTIDENGQTEPERKDPQSSGAGALDIGDEIRVRLFQDLTGDGSALSSFFGSLGTVSGAAFREEVFQFFQLGSAPTLNDFANQLSSGAGFPLDSDPTSGSGAAGTQSGNGSVFLYDIPSGGGQALAERDCFDSSAGAATVGLVWALAVDHANEIQGDSVTLDVGYYAEQCRHNDGSGMSNTA
jgi:predicted ribosomally synthesized peptide with SipW-like signal peptide